MGRKKETLFPGFLKCLEMHAYLFSLFIAFVAHVFRSHTINAIKPFAETTLFRFHAIQAGSAEFALKIRFADVNGFAFYFQISVSLI